MRTHAEDNSFSKISMPCLGIELDELDWDKIKLLIQGTCQTSTVEIVVYILPVPEEEHHDIPVENEPTSEFAQTQEAEESLQHVRQ